MRFLSTLLVLIVTGFAQRGTAAQTNPPTKGTLVIAILSIESSYARNTERPAREVADTLQFWIGPDSAWRIRTYAMDHDIHPHSLGDPAKMKARPTEFAREHIAKHYGEVLRSSMVLEFSDLNDTNAVRQVLAAQKLKGRLEVAQKAGFAFWNPDGGKYKSQTTPK